MTTAKKRDGLLRKALTANGVFSTLCAGTGLTFAGEISAGIGLESVLPVQVVAAGLLPFAGFVFWQARRETMSTRDGWLTVLGDLSWVAATAVLLLAWPELTNSKGDALLTGIAAFVGLWASLQAMGLRRLARDEGQALELSRALGAVMSPPTPGRKDTRAARRSVEPAR